jgi:two-component system, cell cycle response regulator
MGPKILTIEDNLMIRVMIAKAFQSFECELLEAGNGVEGLAVAGREKPDLIILDFSMPVMDGLETLTRLKSDPLLRPIPVVMLTSEAGRDNVLKIAKIGVRDYVIKPFRKEVILERVARIIALSSKGINTGPAPRVDDPLSFVVVDDKPAIVEHIRAGLAQTPWKIQGFSQPEAAMEHCDQSPPDGVLISLSLPGEAAYTLFQFLRANDKTRHVPLFALSVKTAVEEQSRAQQLGFKGIITKPIDPADLKAKICRALNLDTSYKYFQLREDAVVLTLPVDFGPEAANEIMLHLRSKLTAAVDAGMDKLVIDLSQLKTADVHLIKLGLVTIKTCDEMSLKYGLVGSEAARQACQNYDESKDWEFAPDLEAALATLRAKPLAAAA